MAAPRKKKSLFSGESSITRPEISIHLRATPPKLTPIIKEDDRRASPRYKAEFETVVFCAGVSFRTKTLNISMTGVLLAESIPAAFVDQILDIVMIRHVGGVRDFFLVKGKGLEAPLRSPRIHFTVVPDAQRKKIEALIDGLSKSQT